MYKVKIKLFVADGVHNTKSFKINKNWQRWTKQVWL
jgi:hypothetical protein